MVSDVTRPGGVTVTTDVIAGQPVICLRVDTLVRDVLDAITRPFLDEDPTLAKPTAFCARHAYRVCGSRSTT